jgi:two-component system, OmpR family, phosphate regulon response regulator PhoB
VKKILIVDDQPNMRWMIRLALRDYFALEEAGDADAAYARIQQGRPDGIVLDVMMPGSMNGFQLCEYLKRDPEYADIHIVLYTACGMVADQERARRAVGADALFLKPFSPLALAMHLTQALLSADGECAAPPVPGDHS